VVAGEYTRKLTFRSGGGSRQVEVQLTAPLVVRASVGPDGAGLELEWQAESGRVYRVEQCFDLTTPDWREVSGSLVPDLDWVTWLDGPAADGSQRFYRVRADD